MDTSSKTELPVKEQWRRAWSRVRYTRACFQRGWSGYSGLHRGGEAFEREAHAALLRRHSRPFTLATRLELHKGDAYW